MAGIIREEFNVTIRKKRFIILTALLFVAAVASEIATKMTLMNDMTFILKIHKFLMYLFNPLMGSILILSMHRLKFTRSSIIQSEEKGVKRSTIVLGRTIAGALILLVFYLLMFVLIVLLGLVLGARIPVSQIGWLLLKICTDWVASVTTFIVCMFFQYLFAFPAFPIVLYCVLMLGVPAFFELYFGLYSNSIYKYSTWISAEGAMDLFYTTSFLHYLKWSCFLVCLIQIAIFLPLTLLVFKLKKKEKKKKKKKDAEDDDSASEKITPAEVIDGIVP